MQIKAAIKTLLSILVVILGVWSMFNFPKITAVLSISIFVCMTVYLLYMGFKE